MKHTGGTQLVRMVLLSFVAMYALMYLMVDVFGNVYANLSQLYMVVAMAAAMVIIEVAVMKSMYEKGTVMVIAGVSIFALILSIILLRNQVGVSDEEFLRSMIPHHGAALLMCNKARLTDPDIKQLCQAIVRSQQSEINWMQEKLSTF